MTLNSRVPGFEGPCRPVWLNVPGGINHRLDGYLTGFFRRVERRWFWPFGPVRVGDEFHGAIVGGEVYPTEGWRA